MRNQTIRLILYSSIAIVALTLAWGISSIPRQRELAEKTLKNSLEQELIILSAAVKSSTQALRYRLLDVLKSEGNDKTSRAFQASPFVMATLIEWDQIAWKPLWQSSKSKAEYQAQDLKAWLKEWPLAKVNSGDVHFVKVADLEGQAHFAIIVPVRKPNNVPMIGIGIFPANQFGLMFSADRQREARVFDDRGFALALNKPAYLGASLKNETLVARMLEGDEVSVRQEWKSEAGTAFAGAATRMGDSNLSIAVDTPVNFGSGWLWQSWLYLILCALGAVGLNWYLLNSLMQPLLTQISQSDSMIEQLKRQRVQGVELQPRPAAEVKPALAIPESELEDYSFIEPVATPAVTEPETPGRTPLSKVVNSAIRSLDARLKEHSIQLQRTGIEGIEISGDALQLQTALEEILKNAIEAMADADQRWLTISAESRGGRVQLTVEDTGAGVAPEHVAKVFDPFFSTKDAQGVSRGLGLNVVRRVLEEMQGSASVKNRPDRSGAVVKLEWPEENDNVARSPLVDMLSGLDDDDTPPVKRSMTAATAPLDLEDEDEDEFSTLIMEAPLIPTAIRKPRVRTLD